MIKNWKTNDSKRLGEFKIFSIRQDNNISPITGKTHPFYVIEAGDWINIIPVTPDKKVVLVKQYRHAIQEVTLEIPGGMVDDHEKDPQLAAEREMLEETGYKSDQIYYLGSMTPNPAIINNRLHSFLALNTVKISGQSLEGTEDIEVELVDLKKMPGLISSGGIHNALVLGAFYLYEVFAKQKPSLVNY